MWCFSQTLTKTKNVIFLIKPFESSTYLQIPFQCICLWQDKPEKTQEQYKKIQFHDGLKIVKIITVEKLPSPRTRPKMKSFGPLFGGGMELLLLVLVAVSIVLNKK